MRDKFTSLIRGIIGCNRRSDETDTREHRKTITNPPGPHMWKCSGIDKHLSSHSAASERNATCYSGVLSRRHKDTGPLRPTALKRSDRTKVRSEERRVGKECR